MDSLESNSVTELPINQKEYLKKYLAIGKAPGEKKKKKKKKVGTSRVQIIDDDVINITINPANEPIVIDEDAPQIVAIIDERPPSLRIDEKTQNPLWQPVGTVSNVGHTEQKQMIKGFKIEPRTQEKPFALPDRSPPRRKKRVNDDYSPPRKSRSESPPLRDIVIKQERMSVPRSLDGSPPRAREVEDISPPRRSRQGSTDRDMSPPRRRRQGSSERDISPPRRKRQGSSERDMSPPRRNKSKGDYSPPRKTKRDNHSPPRKNRERESSRWSKRDSPPRTSKEPTSQRPDKEKTNSKKMEKTLDGKTAGLQNARELIQETKNHHSREDKLFKSLSKEVSGENAETVHRERNSGKIRNLEEEEEHQRKKREEEQKNKEKYERWGRGLAQVENREQQLKDELHEMSKPLARYADDEDLEKYLKEQEREGDPMLAYIRKKKRKKAADRGEVLKPQFEGEFMPNRYGIKPGHRWDGVDRSNGYEKKWFEVQNEKKAQEEDVYKWSTEDM